MFVLLFLCLPSTRASPPMDGWMKAAGYSKADIREALALYQLESRCTRTDSGWDELKAAHKADMNKPFSLPGQREGPVNCLRAAAAVGAKRTGDNIAVQYSA